MKRDLLKTPTKHGTDRAPATVNRSYEMLRRIFSLAIELKKADSNPCAAVKKLKLDNERYRYLLPEEEPELLAQLIAPRQHCGLWFWLRWGPVYASRSSCDSGVIRWISRAESLSPQRPRAGAIVKSRLMFSIPI